MTSTFPPHLLIHQENLFWMEEQQKTNSLGLSSQVDVVYIDPPYNTGNHENTGFLYNDSKTHDEWLVFMRNRLEATKFFLKDTSVVLVSIDDNEMHYLKVLMDDIFGRKNFIAQLVVDGGANKNNANFFSVTHEYMLVYGANLLKLRQKKTKWRTKRAGATELLTKYEMLKAEGKTNQEITAFLKKWVKTEPFTPRLKVFYNADNKGLYTYVDLSVPGNNYEYDVYHPVTGEKVKPPSRGWGVNEEKFWLLHEQDLIIWGETEDKQPLKKLYLKNQKDQVMKSVLSYPARTPTHELEKLLGERELFNYPKNLQLMKNVLDYVTPENGVVLDIFGGTGTTGQAILELNHEQGLTRRFVLVTKDENNIFSSTTKPRITKVAELFPPTNGLIVLDNIV